MSAKFCIKCGNELESAASFCSNCGQRVTDERQSNNLDQQDSRFETNSYTTPIYSDPSQKKSEAWKSWLVFIGIMMIVGAIIFLVTPSKRKHIPLNNPSSNISLNSSNYSKKKQVVVVNNPYDNSVRQVKDYIARTDPRGANAQYLKWFPVKEISTGYWVRVQFRLFDIYGNANDNDIYFYMDENGVVTGYELAQ